MAAEGGWFIRNIKKLESDREASTAPTVGGQWVMIINMMACSAYIPTVEMNGTDCVSLMSTEII